MGREAFTSKVCACVVCLLGMSLPCMWQGARGCGLVLLTYVISCKLTSSVANGFERVNRSLSMRHALSHGAMSCV
eukprot:364965-Chlamydomonas_euryale.AAC.27